jgi:homoserine acetyltransferase
LQCVVRAPLAVVLFAAEGGAYDGPVKKVFAASHTTVGGKTIKGIKVGYETYGKLNVAGDNAAFVPHFSRAPHTPRQVPANGRGTGLLGFDHRYRASARYRQVFVIAPTR